MTTATEKKPAGFKIKSEKTTITGTGENQKRLETKKSASIKTVNPATNEVVKSFEEMTEQVFLKN